jgi:leucyl/phenylalanyl-tRNA--protein transferase
VPRLLDVQWLTPHLESLGADEIPRHEYLELLDIALDQPAPPWT